MFTSARRGGLPLWPWALVSCSSLPFPPLSVSAWSPLPSPPLSVSTCSSHPSSGPLEHLHPSPHTALIRSCQNIIVY